MGNELARRVRENTGTEVADRETGAPSLAQKIQNMEEHFRRAMPRGAEATQLVRDALTCLRTTPKLMECEPQSVLGSLMTCAQLGLRPGVPGLGHAWVLPFYDRNLKWLDENNRERSGGQRAQLIIGYQGFRELAQRTGQISTMIGRVVYANDMFELDYGIADNLVHRPRLDGPRGDAVGYYAIVKYTSGGYAFWHMSRSEVEEHRDRFAMARKPIWENGKKTGQTEIVGPWRDNFDEMAVKTAFLRLAKWIPKNTDLATAIEADGTVRVDVTPDTDAMLYAERPDAIDSDDPSELPAGTDTQDDAPPTVDAPADEPAAPPAAPATPTGPAPTRTMMARLHALLADCEVTEDERHTTLSRLTKRPITSASDLTKAEASDVIDTLDRCVKSGDAANALDYALSNADQAGAS
jgi:recombination protein RecT